MSIPFKLRSVALAGGIAAVAASAWATHEAINNASYVPLHQASPTVAVTEETGTSSAVAVNDTLLPNETVVTHTDYTPSPVIERRGVETRVEDQLAPAQPPIIVEERRLSADERIQMEVMDRIAGNPHLSGKIGVESRDQVVRLTGWTTTVGQARHAERDARSVMGVRYVENEIRARVGGSV